MKDLDEKIREALQLEDAQLIEEFRGEPSLRDMVIETFRSRHRWIHVTALVMPFVFLLLFFVFGYQFYQAESVRAMIGWSAACLWSATAMGLFKIAYMLELNKNAVTREVKRLELELAQLSRRLPQP
ncbi:MAG: hypothetical protein MUF48_17940 [Pirellulaceae bacterium]|jgi:predicted RND superfamily exporter protein|nr:hypothetical protein [Pirellulaceae bacterium]